MAKQNWKAKGAAPRKRAPRRETSTASDADSKFRISPAVVATILFLGLLSLLLAWLIRFLDPVTPVRLLTITGGNSNAGIPVNASAATDTRVLTNQSVLDSSQASTAPLGQQEMRATLRGILDHQPRSLVLLPWRPTTSIVYVNATGIALPQDDRALAWLLPADFDRSKSANGQLVAFADVVSSVVESEADRKLLVLDCQIGEENFAYAETAAEFVAAAIAQLKAMPPDDMRGLYVLFSCSPGEHAWQWPSRTESIFGHYFSAGVAGAADTSGNNDERVRLDELVNYVVQNVSAQASLLCDARQTPLLMDFDQSTSDVTLVATRSGRGFQRPVAPAQTATRSAVLAGLKRCWTRYHELAQRAPPPYELTPARWARIQGDLLLAEAHFRGNELDDADATIRDVETHFDALVDIQARFHAFTRPSSLTMLSVPSAFRNRGWPEFTEDSDPTAPPDDLIDDLIAEKETVENALNEIAKTAADNTDPIDTDQHLFQLMMAARQSDQPETIGDPERLLLMNRRAAELASLPEHPSVAPWIDPLLDGADRFRRSLEDSYLAVGGTPIRTGSNPVPAAPADGNVYDDVTTAQQSLTRAFRLRDRLLSELPYWIRFLRISAAHVETQAPPEPILTADVDTPPPADGSNIEDAANASPADAAQDNEAASEAARLPVDLVVLANDIVPGLVTDTADLTELLIQDPRDLGSEARADEVAKIAQVAESLAEQRQMLMQRLGEYSEDLSDERLWPASGKRWRRLNALLKLPFACRLPALPQEEVPAEAGSLRLVLLERTFVAATDPEDTAPATPDEAAAKTVKPNDESTVLDKLIGITQLHARLTTVPLPKVEIPSPETTAMEWHVWFQDQFRAVRDTVNRANSPDWVDAARADVAYRLSPDTDFDIDILSATISLHSRAIANHLLHQAVRATEDCYAGTNEGQEQYYVSVARRFRTAAMRLQNSRHFLQTISEKPETTETVGVPENEAIGEDAIFDEQLRELDKLLAKYEQALSNGYLRTEPRELLYRATNSASLSLSLSQGDGLPDGHAAVYLLPQTRVGSVNAASDGSSVGINVIRPAEAVGRAPVEATASFRGHTMEAPLRDIIVDEMSGTSFVYKRQNAGDGRLFVQPRQLSERPLQLMFVLDCSKSMGFEDEQGTPRIRSLTRMLRRFADFAEAGNIEVGIRLFGHRIADIQDPDAHIDTERVLKVGLFAQSRLERILPLRPTGHSPIFNALLDAQGDFPESETDVRREIILISDGADNWAQAGQAPGLPELREAYSASPIRINTVGYNVTRFADREQLQAIASTGGGVATSVANANQLFEELIGLAGLPGMRVIDNEEVLFAQDRLDVVARPISLKPGNYSVEIIGPNSDVITQKAIRVLTGEDHRLIYDSGLLTYSSDPKRNALSVVSGGEDRPDLVVMSARRSDDGLDFEFGLLASETNTEFLLPVAARIAASGRPQDVWRLQSIPPNQQSRHFPAWKIHIENWPADAQRVGLAVRWNQSIQQTLPVELDWDSPHKPVEVAGGIRLVKLVREVDPDGVGPTQATLTFAFDEFGPFVQEWNVVPRTQIASIRHVYQTEVGVYTVQLSLEDGTVPAVVDLVRLHREPTDDVLETEVLLGNQRINR